MSDREPTTPRTGGRSGMSVSGTLSIIVAAIAVILGFLILRDINDDGNASGDGGDDTSVTATTLPGGPSVTTAVTSPTDTTLPAALKPYTVVVANAANVQGAAGPMTTALAAANVVTIEATNSDAHRPAEGHDDLLPADLRARSRRPRHEHGRHHPAAADADAAAGREPRRRRTSWSSSARTRPTSRCRRQRATPTATTRRRLNRRRLVRRRGVRAAAPSPRGCIAAARRTRPRRRILRPTTRRRLRRAPPPDRGRRRSRRRLRPRLPAISAHTTDHLAVEALRVEVALTGDHHVGAADRVVQVDLVGEEVESGHKRPPSAASPPARPPAAPPPAIERTSMP